MTVIVEVPGGVMSGGGGATAALPPPQPAMPRVAEKIAAARIPDIAKRFLPAAVWKARKAISESSASARSGTKGTCEKGGKRMGVDGGNVAGPLVVTVTVKGVAVPFARDTLAGT